MRFTTIWAISPFLDNFVSVLELQVSFDITTFEALQRKYMFSFVSRLLNLRIASLRI